jgi:nucleoside-diphosphate-sugar epimerase
VNNPLKDDLEDIIRLMDPFVWSQLRGKRIFITGGTGFFGKWLLEALVYASRMLSLNLELTVLTRNVSNFETQFPQLFNTGIIHYVEGNVKNFALPNQKFDFIIHAATEASEQLNNSNPFEMIDTIVEGTRRVLEFSRNCVAKKVLFISSGAVYGKQSVPLASEQYMNGPDTLNSKNVYAESKRLAELMCSVYADKFGIEIPIARCFAFVGPYLNLNIHFAIGNFIRDGLAGKTIEIKGDGTPMRSYLYSGDLVIWLLTMLVKGESKRAYNVGSDKAVSIEELAKNVSHCFMDKKVEYIVRQKPDPQKEKEQYVPSIDRARNELGLSVNFDLTESIRRTIKWNSNK